jgi:Peptidase S46
MLRRAALLCALLSVAVSATSRGDEGMWMLHQIASLDAAKLAARGLTLDARAIWDPATRSGLAAAVVSLGGCTASFVSPEGLIATNHHCAFRALQTNATPQHDIIEDGFLAVDRTAELPARGYHVFVFDGYDDVTAAVSGALSPDMTGEQRTAAIEAKEKELVAGCEQPGFRCRVAEMFGGLQYYLFRSIDIRDVRLVYAPPRSIGEYGGEVDNWVWPRHTGDFSMLRAYVGRDGKPADYATDNVPYHPSRWLKLATSPLRDGDLTVLMGYPGRTERYELATAVESDTEFGYPARIDLLSHWIDLLTSASKRSKAAEIALASRIKSYANSFKNGEGMLAGLRRLKLAERKATGEQKLAAWLSADAGREARWGDVLPGMNRLLEARQATRERSFLLAYMRRGPVLLDAAIQIRRWAEERAKPDAERELRYQQRDEAMARQRLALVQRSFDLPADKALMTDVLRRAERLPASERIKAFDAALAATGMRGDDAVAALVDRLYAGTRLGDRRRRLAMFAMSAENLAAQHDAFIELATALRAETRAYEAADKRFDGEMVTLEPRYIEALMAFRGTPLYPDANSTLRFNLGNVKGYSPRDAVFYEPFTTLSGVVEKNTGIEPFACPKALLDAFATGERGPYADPTLGDVPACFLTTNDSTGGNSGSPLMNGKGELVGLLFDGNIESMTSDYAVDPAITRSIGVDVRYMLWVMNYVSHAHALMRELGVEPVGK